MNDFTASNGIIVDRLGRTDDEWTIDPLGKHVRVSRAQMDALREFFQAEADERLGRWRWPDNPDYVVSLDNVVAVVVRESDPSRQPDRIHRRYLEDPVGSLGWGESAARAYFDAHPEPKPWHAAEPGQMWLLTFADESSVPAVTSSSASGHVIFTAATEQAGGTQEFAINSVYITAGRRIWPAE